MKSPEATARSLANLKPGSKPGPRRSRSDGFRLKASKKKADASRTMQSTGAVRDDKAVAAFFDAKRELKLHTPAAIQKLVALLDSKDERVSFSAAREILDRTLGKPSIPEGERSGTIILKWSGEGPSRYGDSIDGQPKDITPKDDEWNATMKKAIELAAHAPVDDDDDDDLTPTEKEN